MSPVASLRLGAGTWIPAATLAVYLVMLAHTCFLSRGDKVLKELNLHEIIKAAQTDHIRDLASMGELKRALIRYHSDIGFIEAGQRHT